MIIPETIQMRASLYGDGAKGYAWQQSRNEEYGVQLDAIRQKHGAPWIEIFTSDFIPDREFTTFALLRAAALEVTDRKPFVAVVISVEIRGKGDSGHCWLCHDGKWVHTIRAQTGWRKPDVDHIPSCDACLEKVKADPVVAVEARQKWVRENPIVL